MSIFTCYPFIRQISWASAIIGLAFWTHAAAQVNCNVGIEFYPSGAIKSCELNGDHRIWVKEGQPVTCVNGKTLTNYPGGKLQSCFIGEPHVFGEVRCQGSNRVVFDEAGNVVSCNASKPGSTATTCGNDCSG